MIKLLLECNRPPDLINAIEECVKIEAELDENVEIFISRLKEDAKDCQAF